MDKKYNRNYSLLIQAQDGSTIKIEPPFSVEFDISRGLAGSVSNASIKVYNLAEETRAQLHKARTDRFVQNTINFLAGYGDKLAIALTGDIYQCFSVREGVNFITSFEVFDGGFGFSNAHYSKEFKEGTPLGVVVKQMLGSLSKFGISIGAIGELEGVSGRGSSYTGHPIKLINQMTGKKCFIDNNQVYVMSDDEYLETDIVEISAATGLMGTPVLENYIVTATMLFEPTLIVGQKVSLISSTAKHLSSSANREYKVISINHRGTISDSASGVATTTVTLSYGDKELSPLRIGTL